ncbi:MAG: hypothetical protein WC641_07535 [Patescibacteria group bacterium]
MNNGVVAVENRKTVCTPGLTSWSCQRSEKPKPDLMGKFFVYFFLVWLIFIFSGIFVCVYEPLNRGLALLLIFGSGLFCLLLCGAACFITEALQARRSKAKRIRLLEKALSEAATLPVGYRIAAVAPQGSDESPLEFLKRAAKIGSAPAVEEYCAFEESQPGAANPVLNRCDT